MKMHRRKFVLHTLAAAGACGLELNRAFADAQTSAAAASQTSAAKLALAVGVLRNVPGSLIVVANEKGMFRNKDFALTIPGKFLSGGGPELLPAVAAGNIDLGLIGDTPAILAMGRGGLPLDVISVGSDTSRVFSIIAGSQIAAMPALAGKRIGLPLGTAFEYFLARALEKFGMRPTDVQLVNLSQAQVQPAFIAKRIDAVLPDTFGRAAILRARPDARAIFSSDGGFASGPGAEMPFRQYNVYIARPQVLKSSAEAIRSFLRTYYQEVTPFLTNPSTQDQAISEMANFLNGAVRGAVTTADLKRQVDLSGYPSLESARRIQRSELANALDAQADFWLKANKVKVKPDFARMLDASLLG